MVAQAFNPSIREERQKEHSEFQSSLDSEFLANQSYIVNPTSRKAVFVFTQT